MATETELMREAIKAQGGVCDNLPDNLQSTLLKKLIEACAAGGGGGGGGGTVSTKYKQPDWGYEEGEVVLPETEIAFDPETGDGYFPSPFQKDLVLGETYTVYINGEKIATCIAKPFVVSDLGEIVFLGNFDPADGNSAVGVYMPFGIMQLPPEVSSEMGIHAAAMLMAEGVTSATFSIEKITYHKIPEDYLPAMGTIYGIIEKEIETGHCWLTAYKDKEMTVPMAYVEGVAIMERGMRIGTLTENGMLCYMLPTYVMAGDGEMVAGVIVAGVYQNPEIVFSDTQET